MSTVSLIPFSILHLCEYYCHYSQVSLILLRYCFSSFQFLFRPTVTAKMNGYDISSYANSKASTVIIAVYLFLFVIVVLYCFVARRNRAWMEFSGKRVLLITAHPDDECMFFGPVIYHACKVASSFSLLCLTKGKQERFWEGFPFSTLIEDRN